MPSSLQSKVRYFGASLSLETATRLLLPAVVTWRRATRALDYRSRVNHRMRGNPNAVAQSYEVNLS